jgi:thioredoxin-related protein
MNRVFVNFAASALLCSLAAVGVSTSLAYAAENAPSASQSIDWRRDDVDAAFKEAKTSGKPIFIYWGATWCPPCNQVKATIFNRQDFIERSHFFVPVYIDGDSPGAQKMGARFKVSGYPTMILLDSNGNEILRLPGEVDADRYLQLLETGMGGGRPIKVTLDSALKGGSGLTDRDWRLLSYYSWETDEQQLIPTKDVPSTLQQLAKRCPAADADAQTRLILTAVGIEASAKKPNLSPAEKTIALEKLNQLLADPAQARQNFDLLTGDDGAIAGLLTADHSAARTTLVQTWNTELDRLIADTTLSNTDRLGAMGSKISLARLETPKGPLPDTLLRQVDAQAEAMDVATTNAYERQSVVNAAAGNYADAGQLDESDRMLKAELTRSHSPYYFMLDLAANAKKRGDTKAALDWYKQAYAASEGPATRLQWGVVYVRAMTELSPQDDAGIVATSDQILKDVGAMPNAFYERNLHGLQKMAESLAKWDAHHDHDAGADKIRDTLQGVCSALPAGDPQKGSCTGLLSTAKSQHA